VGVNYNPAIVTSGLILALDAANPKSYPGSGTAWNDLSGNGKHFAWDAQPTFVSAGGASYINTNGRFATGPASDSFGLTGSSGYTVIFLMQQITLTANYSFLFSKTGTGSANRGIAAHLAHSVSTVYFDQGGCCGSDTRTNIGVDTTSNWCMMSLRRDTNSSNRSIIKNTTTLITNTSAAADISLISEPVYINKNPNDLSLTGAWDIKLGMMLTYNRGLSDVEISQNFNALRGRYGI